MDEGEPGCVARLGNISIIFGLELSSLIALFVFAFLLHYTEHFSIVWHSVHCADEWMQLERTTHSSGTGTLLAGVDRNVIYLGVFILSIVVITAAETARHAYQRRFHSNETIVISNIGLNVPIWARRMLRFLGGYTNGFFLTSIVVDILKHQLASPRPYYLVLCPRLVAYCGNNTDADHHLNHSVVEELCSELDSFELSEARMSFPSSSTSLATYSAMFLLLYTSFVTAHRGLRWARIWVVLALVVLPALVATSRVQSNHNHVVDVVVGAALGASIAVYIVFVHLNVFANRITVSNFFTANRQATKHESSAGATSKHHEESADKEWYWKSFHIPRVYNLRATAVADPIDGSSLGRGDRGETARGSHAALRPKVIEATRFDGFSLDSPNAFVNPAFEPQEENIRLEPIVTSTTANDNNNNYIPHIRRGPRPPPPPVPQPMKTFHH